MLEEQVREVELKTHHTVEDERKKRRDFMVNSIHLLGFKPSHLRRHRGCCFSRLQSRSDKDKAQEIELLQQRY